MDTNKNRIDLLAAGRKKLEQFRKKDQKGSSSNHGKSSGKTSKPENDGDPEEPSKLPEPQPAIDTDRPNTDQSDPSVTTEPVNYPSVPYAAKMEQEELPSISLNHQGQCRKLSIPGLKNAMARCWGIERTSLIEVFMTWPQILRRQLKILLLLLVLDL